MKMNCYYLAIFVYIMNNEVRGTNRLGQVFPHYFCMRYCLLFCQLRIDFHDQRCVSVPHPGLKRFNGNPGKVCLSTEINPEIMTANSNLAPWRNLLSFCQHSFTIIEKRKNDTGLVTDYHGVASAGVNQSRRSCLAIIRDVIYNFVW